MDAIAELGSITRAASHLHVAQPALTRHVQRLEEELDVVLFTRANRGVRLTEAGQKLLEGRDFTMADNDMKLPVAVVNATFAKKHFGNESPLGRRFRPVGNNGAIFDPWRTITDSLQWT